MKVKIQQTKDGDLSSSTNHLECGEGPLRQPPRRPAAPPPRFHHWHLRPGPAPDGLATLAGVLPEAGSDSFEPLDNPRPNPRPEAGRQGVGLLCEDSNTYINPRRMVEHNDFISPLPAIKRTYGREWAPVGWWCLWEHAAALMLSLIVHVLCVWLLHRCRMHIATTRRRSALMDDNNCIWWGCPRGLPPSRRKIMTKIMT